MEEQMVEQIEKQNNYVLKKQQKQQKQQKECEPNEHTFYKVPNSSLDPLWDEEYFGFGLGFKTWECVYCKKKVKSS
jgi:hypothetical protein